MNANFKGRVQSRQERGLMSCVGLDSDSSKLPKGIPGRTVTQKMVRFSCEIVDATCDIAGCYKPNIAFWEAHGGPGISALGKVTKHIRQVAPETPIILDAKRGDIGNTNNGYVQLAKTLDVDAMTVHPTLGREAMQPFLDNSDFCAIVLCKTSNPGAGEFQDLEGCVYRDAMLQLVGGAKRLDELIKKMNWSELSTPFHCFVRIPLYQYVTLRTSQNWNIKSNCGLVVGATYSDELIKVRELAPDSFLLIPGVGKQGGDAKQAAGIARKNFVINSSRDIIFASNGADYAQAARAKLAELNAAIAAGLAG